MTESTPLGELLDSPRFFPRVTESAHRTIEAALAGPNLLEPGITLDGAIIEGAYAAGEPEVLAHLRKQQVPLLVDSHSLRFATPAFLANQRMATLSYAPEEPLTPASSRTDREHFVADALRFQQKCGASHYLTPSVPIRDGEGWAALHHDITALASQANGREVDQKEMVAMVAPGSQAMRTPSDVLSPLYDLPLAAAYIQPLTLDPTHDSVDKLAHVWQFMAAAGDVLPVIAGRVGGFGLVLQALGINAFDSGINNAERYSWADQVRPPTPTDDDEPKKSGGGSKRLYFEQLLTTVAADVAETLLRVEGLRGKLVCTHGCCAFSTQDQLVDRRSEHYLYTRVAQVAELREDTTRSYRLHRVHQRLLAARDLASLARKGLKDLDYSATRPPTFAHLDTWLSLLARAEQLAAEAA